MNFGRFIGILMSVLCLATSIGYLVQKDYRRAVYFFLAACINITVVY